MKYIYQVFIYSYFLSIYCASIWSPKAKKWIKGRQQLLKQIAESYDHSMKSLWIHCASLGEFEQAKPLIESLRSHFPEKRIILSFFSPSGYEIRKAYNQVDEVFYLPLDTRRNARDFIKLINPELAIFVKAEFWYNYLQELDNKQIPFVFMSSVFQTKQYFFRWYGEWFLRCILNAKAIFVQDEDSKKMLDKKAYKGSYVTGDTRIDCVSEMASNIEENNLVKIFKGDSKLLVAGSTWPKDEVFITDFIKQNTEVKLIIAPHEINEKHIYKLCKEIGEEHSIVFSKLNDENALVKRVLVIDQIGLLASLYNYADIVYIGGGFGKGIHNILEPASFGKPIVFGPKHDKFKEARDLIELGTAFSIKNKASFFTIMRKLLELESSGENTFNKGKSYVEQNCGASHIVFQKILEIL